MSGTGASLDYNLRVRKAIERGLFIDLLRHAANGLSVAEMVYASMGGSFVQDHADIHEALGWSKLISFDDSQAVTRRGEFNRPVASIRCLKMSTTTLAATMGTFMREHVGDLACAIWLDYTAPANRGRDLGEVRQIAPFLRHGDVLKMTMNAHLPTLGTNPAGSALGLLAYRLSRLQAQLGTYFPIGTPQGEMTESGLPRVLGRAFNIACSGGLPKQKRFVPLAAFRYADGQQMVTFSGVMLETTKVSRYMKRSGFDAWPFRVQKFDDVRNIDVPTLSLREKVEIDHRLGANSVECICEELRLGLGDSLDDCMQHVRNYAAFQRFYPKFVRMSAV